MSSIQMNVEFNQEFFQVAAIQACYYVINIIKSIIKKKLEEDELYLSQTEFASSFNDCK